MILAPLVFLVAAVGFAIVVSFAWLFGPPRRAIDRRRAEILRGPPPELVAAPSLAARIARDWVGGSHHARGVLGDRDICAGILHASDGVGPVGAFTAALDRGATRGELLLRTASSQLRGTVDRDRVWIDDDGTRRGAIGLDDGRIVDAVGTSVGRVVRTGEGGVVVELHGHAIAELAGDGGPTRSVQAALRPLVMRCAVLDPDAERWLLAAILVELALVRPRRDHDAARRRDDPRRAATGAGA